MSNTFSPRTEGPVGKAAARSQTYAANLTIPLILNAGSDMQYNQQPTTGHEHQHEGGDSSAQAPALHKKPMAERESLVGHASPRTVGSGRKVRVGLFLHLFCNFVL